MVAIIECQTTVATLPYIGTEIIMACCNLLVIPSYNNNTNTITNSINELRLSNKKTAVAHGMGFSSTTQLDNTISGKAMISTKAITNLVRNYDVNPTFLFTGTGTMFLNQVQEPKEKFEYFYNSTL